MKKGIADILSLSAQPVCEMNNYIIYNTIITQSEQRTGSSRNEGNAGSSVLLSDEIKLV